MPRILNIVGCKNSGKTRCVELLVPMLQSLGMNVGTLKHTECDGFDWDIEGKDTYRHAQAGSAITGIFGPHSFACNIKGSDGPQGIDGIVRLFYGKMDIVLVEGLKADPGLKLEVCRPKFSDRRVTSDNELLGTYGANLFDLHIPHFDYDCEEQLGRFIVENRSRLRNVTPL